MSKFLENFFCVNCPIYSILYRAKIYLLKKINLSNFNLGIVGASFPEHFEPNYSGIVFQ